MSKTNNREKSSELTKLEFAAIQIYAGMAANPKLKSWIESNFELAVEDAITAANKVLAEAELCNIEKTCLICRAFDDSSRDCHQDILPSPSFAKIKAMPFRKERARHYEDIAFDCKSFRWRENN